MTLGDLQKYACAAINHQELDSGLVTFVIPSLYPPSTLVYGSLDSPALEPEA